MPFVFKKYSLKVSCIEYVYVYVFLGLFGISKPLDFFGKLIKLMKLFGIFCIEFVSIDLWSIFSINCEVLEIVVVKNFWGRSIFFANLRSLVSISTL